MGNHNIEEAENKECLFFSGLENRDYEHGKTFRISSVAYFRIYWLEVSSVYFNEICYHLMVILPKINIPLNIFKFFNNEQVNVLKFYHDWKQLESRHIFWSLVIQDLSILVSECQGPWLIFPQWQIFHILEGQLTLGWSLPIRYCIISWVYNT